MSPSIDIFVEEEDVKMEKKKRKKFKDLSAVENFMAAADDSAKKKKKKKNNFENNSKSNVGVEEEAVLIQLIAKYLDKRNLQKTLSSFLSETRCKSSWKTQTKDLQDIYNQYSIQDNKNLKKHNVEDIDVEGEKNYLSIDNRNNNLKFLEEEVRTKDASKVVNSKVAPSSKGDLKISGALKPHVSGSDKSVTSCDDAQNELAKIKNKKRKAPGKDIDQDSDKTPKQTGSVKLEKSLQESLEVTKEEKMKKKYILDKNLIDNDEHKTSTCKENENSIKDNSKRSKTSLKQTDCGNLDNSSHESLELLKEAEKKKKKKNSDNKDLIDNDEKKKSTNIENGSPIKNKSRTFKTPPKKKNSGKLDKSLQEALEVPKEKKNKKNFEEKNLIANNEKKISTERENRISIEGNRKPSKTSNKYKNILELNESVRGSLEVLRQKRIKEQDAEDKDSGDNDQQNSAEKNKKEKKELKKKLESSDSNVTNEETTKRNLKDLAEDADKALGDNTPGQKGVKEDEREANFSSNSKQKSGEPTTAKAFQRVKVEVQFVDPRLQDNSYWAKSGSDIGYGAKAEQVLGQVRGKDFRHEKTKKKRGSYKGGMIDMQSHSIKFSYSDDE